MKSGEELLRRPHIKRDLTSDFMLFFCPEASGLETCASSQHHDIPTALQSNSNLTMTARVITPLQMYILPKTDHQIPENDDTIP